MRKLTHALMLGLTASTLALAGCKTTSSAACCADGTCDGNCEAAGEPATMGAMNEACPFTGRPVNAAQTVSFEGQEVGFCCANCAGKFAEMTDAEKQAAIGG